MKIPNTRAVISRFDRVPSKEPGRDWDAALPEDTGPVHVYFQSEYQFAFDRDVSLFNKTEPNFDDVPVRVECGRKGWAILPFEFNNTDPDACPECVELAKLRVEGSDEYQQRHREIEESNNKSWRF